LMSFLGTQVGGTKNRARKRTKNNRSRPLPIGGVKERNFAKNRRRPDRQRKGERKTEEQKKKKGARDPSEGGCKVGGSHVAKGAKDGNHASKKSGGRTRRQTKMLRGKKK